jgi:hypothetical protein
MRDRSLLHLAALLVLTAAPPAFAQGASARAPLIIQGRVTDGARNPVVGAQVAVEGMPIGTMTADDGTYRLLIARAPSPFTLVARRIGFRPGRSSVTETEGTITRDFALPRDVLELSQVVTTATRTETERAQLGATLSSVSGEALSNAVTPQLDVALSGKVPGALVTQNSGTPGGAVTLPTLAAVLDEIYRQRRYALFLSGTRWADERRFGRIAEARTTWLPYPAQETVANPNPPTTP